jgi:putative transposase
MLPLLRYIEHNPLRAHLVRQTENLQWGSLHRRLHESAEKKALLTDPPVPLGCSCTERVGQLQSEPDLAALWHCVARGQPFGGASWMRKVSLQSGLENTICPRGRPRRKPADNRRAR